MSRESSPCPICRKDARPRAENGCSPFCGARCQQIDLGRWLDEKYRVPVEEIDQDLPATDDPS